MSIFLPELTGTQMGSAQHYIVICSASGSQYLINGMISGKKLLDIKHVLYLYDFCLKPYSF
jgi:hypothetical protein